METASYCRAMSKVNQCSETSFYSVISVCAASLAVISLLGVCSDDDQRLLSFVAHIFEFVLHHLQILLWRNRL